MGQAGWSRRNFSRQIASGVVHYTLHIALHCTFDFYCCMHRIFSIGLRFVRRLRNYRYIIIIIIFLTLGIWSLGILEKIDTKERIVGVTITPGSPPEQKNRAAERCYIAAWARKRAGTKMQYRARRQNVGWFSSLEVRENQKLIHWLGPESRPQLVEKDNQLPRQNIYPPSWLLPTRLLILLLWQPRLRRSPPKDRRLWRPKQELFYSATEL